jgi:hypothetical protein
MQKDFILPGELGVKRIAPSTSGDPFCLSLSPFVLIFEEWF